MSQLPHDRQVSNKFHNLGYLRHIFLAILARSHNWNAYCCVIRGRDKTFAFHAKPI